MLSTPASPLGISGWTDILVALQKLPLPYALTDAASGNSQAEPLYLVRALQGNRINRMNAC